MCIVVVFINCSDSQALRQACAVQEHALDVWRVAAAHGFKRSKSMQEQVFLQAFLAVLAFGRLITAKRGHISNQHHSKFSFRV